MVSTFQSPPKRGKKIRANLAVTQNRKEETQEIIRLESELFGNFARITEMPSHHEVLRFPTVDDAKQIRSRVNKGVVAAITEGCS